MDWPKDGPEQAVPAQGEAPPARGESVSEQAAHSAGGSSTQPQSKNTEKTGLKKPTFKKRLGKVSFSGVEKDQGKFRQKKKAVARKAPKKLQGQSSEKSPVKEIPSEVNPKESGNSEDLPPTHDSRGDQGTSPLPGLENLQMPDTILSPHSLDSNRSFAHQSEGMPFFDKHDNIDGMIFIVISDV